MSLFWFVIVGIIGTIALAAFSFVNWAWWWRAAASLVAILVVTGLIAAPNPPILGPQTAWIDASPFRELILFTLMLVGMASRVLSVAIEDRKNIKEQRPVGISIDRWEFVYPMLFAVPTFGALLSQVRAETLGLTDIVLAFQTGFFWQTILKKQERI